MTQEELEVFARARLGTTVKDRWTLDELLGVGGTASVYGASHRNGKRVAVKILHPELSAHEHFRERFLREAYVGNHIEHEGAVTVHDDDTTEDGCAFLVMDLLEGENLEVRRERKGGTLDALEVLSLTDAVLDTLTAAHAKGVIHRDIKPENLFLTLENTVRLLDFGIARINVPESPGQTLAGISMGTPAFMPPEQASAHWDKVDAQSDLWALGASMFTLLTGRYVHQGGTVNESLVLAVTQSAPKLENIDPSIPERVCQIVNKALHREKAQRYKNALEMQFDVRLAFRDLQLGGDEGQRYSLSDGRLAMHSAPPAPVAPLDDARFGAITGEAVSADMWRTGPLQRLTPQQRKLVFAGAGAALFIGLLLLFGGDDSSSDAAALDARERHSTQVEGNGDDRAPEPSTPTAAPSPSSTAIDPRDLPAAEAHADAGEAGAGDAEESSPRARKRGTSRASRSRPAAARPPGSESAAGEGTRPTTAAPSDDDFDPFAKRH